QGGKRAIDLALEQGHGLCVQLLRDWAQNEGEGPRHSLSFLTEDCSDVGLLSSTRVSQLEEPGLGGSCGSGEPPCCAQPPSGSSLAPWFPGGPAVPLQPLASSTLLWALDEPEEPSFPQGTSSSSPTVLLAPGDHGCAQNPQSDAQGSLSPTVLLSPGGPRNPQDSPLDAQGSPSSVVLPGAGNAANLQDSPSCVRGSTSATDPGVPEPGTPPLPRSCTGCIPHRPMEAEGRPPPDSHGPGAEATSSGDREQVWSLRMLSDEALLRRLRALGHDPGPITVLTRRVPELADALRTGRIPDCTEDEMALVQQFDCPDRSRRWREGLLKTSFNYLLLDPRTTRDLPLRCHRLSPMECFRTFVDAVFYVGKGTRARPYYHLAEAVTQHRMGTRKGCPKVRRILEIWASGLGVISLHCFQSSVPAEAYTREGCLLEALGLRAVTNQRKGNCYGVVASWDPARRRRMGVHMLHRAMRIFLAEGERQLRPADIQAGR
ncbi:ANKL1 protein, partial [Odontophorus gujanensis]|nr:ANKL1 protein [Odontophorus gujanensis]